MFAHWDSHSQTTLKKKAVLYREICDGNWAGLSILPIPSGEDFRDLNKSMSFH
jgi:hypothetical protein